MKTIPALLFVALLPSPSARRADEAPAGKPNIVVILTDDQTFRGIGHHNREVKTPRLDALAASGITFERAYVASPICAASRASLLTGRFPQQHGVIALETKAFAPFHDGGAEAAQTLPRRLATAGYRSAFFGKSHLGKPTTYGFDAGEELAADDDILRKATEFLRTQRPGGKPFFLWVALHQPHIPLKPEQRWLDLYAPGSITVPGNFRVRPEGASLEDQGVPGKPFYRESAGKNGKGVAGPPRDEASLLAFMRSYYAVISRLDDQVGRFADELRDTGLLKSTVVFFLSDNGYHLGSHGLGNKITMHEESVRIPMFAFGSGIPAGRKTAALVSSLDVYPTACELAGAAAPPRAPMGKSLVPLFANPDAAHRTTVFSECVGVGGKPGQGHRMARDDRWKLVLSMADEEFLFDQQDDPLERKNLVADPKAAPVVARLRTELSAWMKSVGDRPYPAVK